MTTIIAPSARTLSAALTLALGLLAAAPPASAAVTYTYTGAVSGGLDETGVFGLAGQRFEGRGLTFTATFVREDTPGATYVFEPTQSQVRAFGAANSPLHGTLTINEHTISVGSWFGQQFQLEDPTWCGAGCEYELFNHHAQTAWNQRDPDSGIDTYIDRSISLSGFGANQNFLTSSDYHTLPSLSLADGVTFNGLAHVEEYVLDPNGERLSYSFAEAYLKPTSMTVSDLSGPIGGVPEPASWALMIVGFGSAGAMLRSRRRWAALV